MEKVSTSRDAGYPLKLVVAYCDPLLPAHARSLAALAAEGSPLMVMLADPPEPLLDSRARAELVAGMADVAWVTIVPIGGLMDAAQMSGSAAVINEQEPDLRRRAELVRRVHERHGAPRD